MDVNGDLEAPDIIDRMVWNFLFFLFSVSVWYHYEIIVCMIFQFYLFIYHQIYGDMCHRLAVLVQKMMEFVPIFEALQPPRSGMQALCGLYWAIDRAKLFLHRTVNSSKLYLVTLSTVLSLNRHTHTLKLVTKYQNASMFFKFTRISLTALKLTQKGSHAF